MKPDLKAIQHRCIHGEYAGAVEAAKDVSALLGWIGYLTECNRNLQKEMDEVAEMLIPGGGAT